MNKNIFIVILLLALIGIGAYALVSETEYKLDNRREKEQNNDYTTPQGNGEEQDNEQNGEQEKQIDFARQEVIGQSVGGHDIVAYKYGTGAEIVFIGGIHGGYSWNTNLLSYELIDYIKQNSSFVPNNLQITIIPTLNPDGLKKTVGIAGRFDVGDVPSFDPNDENIVAGRYNENGVDLNRNFDCEWQKLAKWRDVSVSGGSEPFSEPESKAIKEYIENNNIKAVVTWYAAAGGVYSSSCHNGISEETRTLTNEYAEASGYPAYEEFDFYEITGDMVNWMAKENISAISVLLSNHEDIEWDKNKNGIKAVIEYYSKQ